MKASYYRKLIRSLEDDYDRVLNMTDEEVGQQLDSTREEFLELTLSEIEYYNELLDRALGEDTEEYDCMRSGLDPAFNSWSEFYSMFI